MDLKSADLSNLDLQLLRSPHYQYSDQFFAHSDYTAAGQVSSLCSIYDNIRPDDPGSSVMRDLYGIRLRCLPQILKENGYTTSFFNGYLGSFDNKRLMLPTLGFNTMEFSRELKKGLGPEDASFVWGVRDDYVLKALMKKQDADHKTGKPFLSFFMSVNTHPPYDMTDESITGPQNLSKRERAVYMTDQHLKRFFEQARSKDWYEDTLFLITSDNGSAIGGKKAQKLSKLQLIRGQYQVPFILYHPKMKSWPETPVDGPFGQIDIPPTILHLAGIKNVQAHFMGSSIFAKQRHPYLYAYRYHAHHYFFSGNSVYDLTNDKYYGKPNKRLSRQDFKKIREASAHLLLYNKLWPPKVP